MFRSLRLRLVSYIAGISLGLVAASSHVGGTGCESVCSTDEECLGTACFPQSKCSLAKCEANAKCSPGYKDLFIYNWDIGYCGDGPNPGLDCVMNKAAEECAFYSCGCYC
jgi:hypothetical protein